MPQRTMDAQTRSLTVTSQFVSHAKLPTFALLVDNLLQFHNTTRFYCLLPKDCRLLGTYSAESLALSC